MANATRTALADLYTTILDMAYHPNRYGNAAMREEREAQLNRIRSYMDDRYKQIAAFEDWRKNRRAERYLSTVEKNKQNFLMQGGSLEDFYKKQRDAIMKDKYFQNLAPEEQHNILNSFGKRSADAAGRLGLSTNDWDRGDDLSRGTLGYGLPGQKTPPNMEGMIKGDMPTIDANGTNAEQTNAEQTNAEQTNAEQTNAEQTNAETPFKIADTPGAFLAQLNELKRKKEKLNSTLDSQNRALTLMQQSLKRYDDGLDTNYNHIGDYARDKQQFDLLTEKNKKTQAEIDDATAKMLELQKQAQAKGWW